MRALTMQRHAIREPAGPLATVRRRGPAYHLQVDCGAGTHRVVVRIDSLGRVRAEARAHDRPAEEVLMALGGPPPACLRVASTIRSLGAEVDPDERVRWAAAGVEAHDARAWIHRGFRPPDAVRWRAIGVLDAAGAAAWQKWAGSPARAREWIAAGVTEARELRAWHERRVRLPDEVRRWQAVGVRSATSLSAWREEGLATPAGVAAWRDAGILLAGEVRAWRQAGVTTPEEMTRWQSNGFHSVIDVGKWTAAGVDPDSAAAWAAAGIAPEEAARWRRLGVAEPRGIRRWREVGVTRAEEAHEWRVAGAVSGAHIRPWKKVGVATASELRDWRCAGVRVPDDVRRWSRVGVSTAGEALEWFAAGCGPEDLPLWQRRGVMTADALSSRVSATRLSGVRAEADRRDATSGRGPARPAEGPADAWSAVGIPPGEALSWQEAGVVVPELAVACRAAGLTIGALHTWRYSGVAFGAAEVLAWHGAGVSDPRVALLRVRDGQAPLDVLAVRDACLARLGPAHAAAPGRVDRHEPPLPNGGVETRHFFTSFGHPCVPEVADTVVSVDVDAGGRDITGSRRRCAVRHAAPARATP